MKDFIYEKEEDLYKQKLPSGKSNPLYSRWRNMKQRCSSKKHRAFPRYGGRGIKICNEWRNSSQAFILWAVSHPTFSPELEIDRIKNNEGYSPENCHFVTHSKNCQNREVTDAVSKSSKRNGESCSKKIVKLDDGLIYDSIRHASRVLNIPASSLSACCLGRVKSAGGYKWKFYC